MALARNLRVRIDEIKAWCEKNPSFKRTALLLYISSSVTMVGTFPTSCRQDTYNAGKTRFWCERKTTASMEQAHRTEITDRMTMEAEPDMDEKGENVLIRDDCHGFNLSDFDIGAGASASGAGSSSDNPGMPAGGDTKRPES